MSNMKKQDFLYLFLSVVLVILSSYIYVTYGNTHVVEQKNKVVKPIVVQEKPSSEKPAPSNPLEGLTKKIDDLEKHPTAEAITAVKTELEQLPTSTQREDLLARLNRLNDDLPRIAEAETALQATIDSPTQANIAYTQGLIDQVTTPAKKQSLQDQLNSLGSGITETTTSSSSSVSQETSTEEEEVFVPAPSVAPAVDIAPSVPVVETRTEVTEVSTVQSSEPASSTEPTTTEPSSGN